MFESLSGVKSRGDISSKQFSELQKKSQAVAALNKVDLELLYKKLTTQSRTNQMNYQLFIQALEELAKKVPLCI